MMKKMKINIFIAMLILGLMAGCSANAELGNSTGKSVLEDTDNENSAKEKVINIDKLEIYHFHATSQCYSCITVGDYAEATVNEYFKDELEKGIIVFDHINGQLEENRELVKKYGVTGSSIWLGSYKGDGFTAEQNIQVWYKIRNKQEYMDYFKGVIEDKLSGN